MNHIQVIEHLLALINQINKEQPESQWILEEGTTSADLINHAEWIVRGGVGEDITQEYPIQDDVWPSRRWNKDHTDYIDLSGE